MRKATHARRVCGQRSCSTFWTNCDAVSLPPTLRRRVAEEEKLGPANRQLVPVGLAGRGRGLFCADRRGDPAFSSVILFCSIASYAGPAGDGRHCPLPGVGGNEGWPQWGGAAVDRRK